MSHTRREFMRDMAAAGAAFTACGAIVEGAGEVSAAESSSSPERCPYFDQPMYCKGLSQDGHPMCEK